MIRKARTGDFWIIDGDSHIGRWIEESGQLVHDQNALPIILKHIPEGGCVVDAGAYCGDHTFAYLQQVGPTGRVLAFEPNPEAFQCLKLNCPEALCFQVALSDQRGTGHLIMPKDQNFGTCRVVDLNAAFKYGGEVEMIALDSLVLNKLDLFKLDCEGGEYDALLGASETIARCHPVIVCEVNESALKAHDNCTPQDLLELIASYNYDIKNLYPRQDIGGQMCDVLCLPI